jgi:hypothetical protein
MCEPIIREGGIEAKANHKWNRIVANVGGRLGAEVELGED